MITATQIQALLNEVSESKMYSMMRYIEDRWSTRAIHFGGENDRADRGLAALPEYDLVGLDSPPWTPEQIVLFRSRYFDKPPYTAEITDYFAQIMQYIGLENITITPITYEPAWGDDFSSGYAETSSIYGSIIGSDEPNKHLILCAHYDTFGGDITSTVNNAPGADDSGLSCCALLEIARIIKSSGFSPYYTIDIVLLGSEETGEAGSGGELYAQSLVDDGVDVMLVINVDMIAYSAAGSSYQIKCHPYSTDESATPEVYTYQSIIKSIFNLYTGVNPVDGRLDNTASDSHAFFVAGFPVVYIEENNRTPHYHSANDTLDNADTAYLTAITKGILASTLLLGRAQKGESFVSTFTNTDFSTLESIAAIEAEINNMSRPYSRKAVSVAATVQLTASPDTITTIKAIKSNNTSVNLVKSTGTWALPVGEYIRFVLNDGDYFNVTDGTGDVITSNSGLYTLAFGTAPTWVNITIVSTWQNKIDIAKLHVYNLLSATLRTRFVNTDWNIDEIINAITNPQVLYLASDYKSLEMIYMDLAGKMSTSEAYQIKIEQYSARYASAMQDALAALDFGQYGKPYVSNVGRVSR